MKYLIFSELNKNHFLFLSFLIITILYTINYKYIEKTKDIIQSFHNYYIYTLSDFLSIIPFIIIKLRSKSASEIKLEQENTNIRETSSKENNVDISNNIILLHSDSTYEDQKRRKRRIIKLIILISFFDFLGIYSNLIFNIIIERNNYIINRANLNSFILFNITFKYLFSIFILHLPVYKHHYLSLGINFIFLIGLVIYDIINIKEKRQYYYVLMKIISVILFSLEDVYAKILLSFDSISPYIYLFYRGICTNILALLFSIAFIFIELPYENENGDKVRSCVFSRLWKLYESKLNILFYIIMFILQYFKNLNIFLIIDKFSLIHFAIASILENIVSLFLSIIKFSGNIGLDEFFIKIAIYFILILAALIYIEFIVLNFCGLQKNTQLFLHKEAKNDIMQTMLNNNNDNDSNAQNEIINEEEKSVNDFKESNLPEDENSIYE